MWIGDLVQHQHDALAREGVEVGRGQGVRLSQQALMDGIRAQAAIDLVGPDDLRRHAGIDLFFREPPGGVLGEKQFAESAGRVRQRSGDRVPAIKNDWTISLVVAVAPGRPAAGTSVLAAALRICAPKARFSRGIAHAALVHGLGIMAISGLGPGMKMPS